MMYGLKAGFWVRATLRRLNQEGLIAVVAQKGDEDAGSIFIILTDRQNRIAILREQGDTWHRQSFEDTETASAAMHATDYMERQKRYDPDLWIIEIDVPDSTAPLETKLGTRRFNNLD